MDGSRRDQPDAYVLTGGGHGGKSALITELRRQDPDGRHWITIPELSDLRFEFGLERDARSLEFEFLVHSLQVSIEDLLVARATDDRRAIVCHRGTLDTLAFWLRKGGQEEDYFRLLGTSKAREYARYACVILLQSTAIDAESVYKAAIVERAGESIEMAAALDRLCAEVWREHPKFIEIVNHETTWAQKCLQAIEAIYAY